MENIILSLFSISFIISEIVLYVYLSKKFRTLNPIRIAKLWIKEYF